MLNLILNNINIWKVDKRISKLLYIIFNFGYWNNNIKVGDRVKCLGIGYPHWRNQAFLVKVVYSNGFIGLDNKIKVNKKDFKKFMVK
jgi:hypothetical protein